MELIFCNNPNENGKIILGFCQGNQVDAYKNTSPLKRDIEKIKGTSSDRKAGSPMEALAQGPMFSMLSQTWT